MRASDIMTRAVVSVSPDHGIQHAARSMLEHHISGLPVIDDDNQLVGMLTEGDLLRRSEFASATWVVDSKGAIDKRKPDPADYIKSMSWRVRDVMSQQVFTVDEDSPVAHIVKLMSTHDIKRIPVMRNGSVIGIVSRADLLKALVAALPDQTANGDDAIKLAVLTRLVYDLGIDRNAISVDVTDCNVLLTGEVASISARQAAGLAAESVRGVDGVVNQLRVAGG